MADKQLQQTFIGNLLALPGKRRVEYGGDFSTLFSALMNAYRHALPGRQNSETVSAVHRHKRADIHQLMAAVADNLFIGFVVHQQVAVSLTEGVADFVENHFDFTVAVVAEVDTQGVKCVPQYSWILRFDVKS